MAAEKQYDFIIVGAGPAGCTLARRLADSSTKPSVLLLEAGPPSDDKYRLNSDRFFSMMDPNITYDYSTEPQKHLRNRKLSYVRGKGVGGSSGVNFAGWTIGPKSDYDYWARVVGDESFNWAHTQPRYKRIERYNFKVSPGYEKYFEPKAEDHGDSGLLKVSMALEWEPVITKMLDGFEGSGTAMNKDNNSGDPLGASVFANTAWGSRRSTAADFVDGASSNLTVVTGERIHGVIMDGKKAVGVKSKSSTFHATKEVILSAGALDTPQILLLSGIGPKSDLEKHGINCIHDLPYLGKTLQDRPAVPLGVNLKPGVSTREVFENDVEAQKAAREEYLSAGTGPLSVLHATLAVGWLKSDDTISSEEYKALPSDLRQYRTDADTSPSFEFAVGPPARFFNEEGHVIGPTDPVIGSCVFGTNVQSRGTVTLASANPDDRALFQPDFLSDPYDRRSMINAVRWLHSTLSHPAFSSVVDGFIGNPPLSTDEECLAFIEKNAITTWHMSCTVKMGPEGDETASADADFKVRGLDGLRVVDMSVAPFLPNCHTQSIAYWLGETAAEKLVSEYGL